MTAPHPLSITDEGPFLDEIQDLDDLAELRQALIATGQTAPVTNGLCSWLLAKKAGQPDQSNSATRARYRRILRELVDDGRGPKGKRRRLHLAEFPIVTRVRARVEAEAKESGASTVAVLAGVAAAAMVAMVGLAEWAAPIILEHADDDVT